MEPRDFFIVNEILIILINAISLWMAILVHYTDKKAKLNSYFFKAIIFLICWVDFFFIAVFANFFIPKDFTLFASLTAGRAVVFFTGPFLFTVYLFTFYFPVESKRNHLTEWFFALVWAAMSLIAFTDLIMKKVELNGWQLKIYGGELMNFFLLYAVFFIILILFNVYKKYRRLTSPEEKSKSKYFFLGMVFIGMFNIIFNAVIPLSKGGNFVHNPIFFLFGIYSTLLMDASYAYAIINKQLFNARVLLTQLLVVVMGILLLITPFLVNIPWLKTLLSMVFLLFCVFGWLLVRSSIREVRQKEILEQTVEERTKELRASKHELELNKIELEKKVQELEKWYKLTVGRELRMVELKQKIKELEEDLKSR